MLRTKTEPTRPAAALVTRSRAYAAGLLRDKLEDAESTTRRALDRLTNRGRGSGIRSRVRRVMKRDAASRARRGLRRATKQVRARSPVRSLADIPRPVLVGVGVAVVAAGTVWAIRGARKRRRRGRPSQSEMRDLIASNAPGTQRAS